jgi:hypothetical protein
MAVRLVVLVVIAVRVIVVVSRLRTIECHVLIVVASIFGKFHLLANSYCRVVM